MGIALRKTMGKLVRKAEEPVKLLKKHNNKKRLKNEDFTIISNNCWGGFVYQSFDIRYNSPFVGLFLHPKDYIKLLSDLEHYLNRNLLFTDKSKYQFGIEKKYPIGLLDDVEIHFLHYESEEEALTKWNKRLQRMNMDNLFIGFAETKACTVEELEQFDALNFDNKVFFTAQEYDNFKSSVLIKGYEKQGYLSADYLEKYDKYFDSAKWLNREIGNF